ncbi:acyl carrier protein [Acetitomaculum ruminis DSM 5522]|uniref:Acyl carrier protein n=1 Tax=Acetitomaculum ruminis DSM 5522 TaxID=1120918 RepID=A0A1I0ZRN3_9FIRM|nr:acyl carrier protein [Acetitomaculum ruminis]SFB26813.1 acyl carrier protein [Acetitomaculum ruminis DSM 5522]
MTNVKENIKDNIVRIIAEYLDKEESEISPSANFNDYGLDSLDIMELAMQIQDELDCKFELSQEITNVEKLVELIESQN